MRLYEKGYLPNRMNIVIIYMQRYIFFKKIQNNEKSLFCDKNFSI